MGGSLEPTYHAVASNARETHHRGVTAFQRWMAASIVLAAGLFLRLFYGTQNPGCLGPLGVTHVQCVAVSGVAPTVWWGPAFLVVAVFAAAWIAWPIKRGRWVASLIAAILGFATGAAIYLAARPRVLEGPTSTGEHLTVLLPVDRFALLAAGLAGAALLAFLVGHIPIPRRTDLRSA
jgi:hypothetical protein